MTQNPDLVFGLIMAQAIEQLRKGLPPWPLLDALDPQSWTLAQGLLAAYQRYIWPRWVDEYELVGTEVEGQYRLTPEILYMARPDAIIKRKRDQTYWILSDKTSSLSADAFGRIWDKTVQHHAECVVAEQQLNMAISGFFVQGWLKGYKKAESIYSPLCNAWCKRGQPGMSTDQWSAEYKYGWPRTLISQYPGSVAGWIEQLGEQACVAQFPVAGPIMVNRPLVEEYLQDAQDREACMQRDIERGAAVLALFPRRFEHCDDYGKYRRPCQFREVCWVPTIGRAPLSSGLFQPRVPHHVPEALAMSQGGER